jgi:hypothetical protein
VAVLTAQLNIADRYFFSIVCRTSLTILHLATIDIRPITGVISLVGHDASVNFDSGSGGSRKQSSMIARLVDCDVGSSFVNRVDAKY